MTSTISPPPKKTKTAPRKTAQLGTKSASGKKEDLYSHIAAAAYYKAESRGFEPGYELDDWLEAEIELMGDQQKH